MASFIRKLLGGNTTLGVSRSLLYNCKNHASHEDWFTHSKGMIGTDFRSRHSILMVHIWMVHRRLLRCDKSSNGLTIQECLFDELWDDTSIRIRAAGINELSINKYLTQVQGYSFKTCVELDEAMTKKSNDEKIEEIAGTIWRTVYNKRDEIDEDRVLALASYVHTEHASLLSLQDAAILDARIEFAKVPKFNPVPHSGAEKALATSIDELIGRGGEEEEWKAAVASNGRTYYFNVKTRETRWDAP